MVDQTNVMEQPKQQVRDKLDEVRASAQKLHKAITSTLTKRNEVARTEVEALKKQARDTASQARSAMGERFQEAHERIQQKLGVAADKLEAAERHASDSLKKSGQEFHESLMKALAEARASTKELSEAVAAKRSEFVAKQKQTEKA